MMVFADGSQLPAHGGGGGGVIEVISYFSAHARESSDKLWKGTYG